MDGELEHLLGHLAPELRAHVGVVDSLKVVQRAVPHSAHTVELANAEVFRTDRFERRRLWYQLRSDSAAVLLSLVLQGDSAPSIWAFQSHDLPAPLQEIHAFRPWERPVVYTVLLVIPVAVVAFSFYTAARVLRSGMRKRWLWALVALVGVGKITLNWTTGGFSHSMLSLQLFGAGFVRLGLLGPWLISFSFPLGALVALDRLRQSRTLMPAPLDVENPSSTPVNTAI